MFRFLRDVRSLLFPNEIDRLEWAIECESPGFITPKKLEMERELMRLYSKHKVLQRY